MSTHMPTERSMIFFNKAVMIFVLLVTAFKSYKKQKCSISYAVVFGFILKLYILVKKQICQGKI